MTGLTPGKTTVRAQVGKLSATATVTVSAAANVRVTPPLKPLQPGPLTGIGPNAIRHRSGLDPDRNAHPAVGPQAGNAAAQAHEAAGGESAGEPAAGRVQQPGT